MAVEFGAKVIRGKAPHFISRWGDTRLLRRESNENLLLLATALMLLTACGGDNPPTSTINPDAVFVSSLKYQISADVDPTTLSQLQTVYFNGEAILFPPEEISTIVTQDDLDLYNQYFPPDEQISLADLDLCSSFLLRAPTCPYWHELAGIQPSSQATNEYTLTVNLFTLTDVACPAVIQTAYSVFRAEKPWPMPVSSTGVAASITDVPAPSRSYRQRPLRQTLTWRNRYISGMV